MTAPQTFYESAMKSFTHDFRVFEVSPSSGAQFEIVLVSMVEPASDRRRLDRVTTGQLMGKVRLIVDLAHADSFELGRQFTLTLQEKEIS
jgi:hypothetical protein